MKADAAAEGAERKLRASSARSAGTASLKTGVEARDVVAITRGGPYTLRSPRWRRFVIGAWASDNDLGGVGKRRATSSTANAKGIIASREAIHWRRVQLSFTRPLYSNVTIMAIAKE